MSLGTPCRACVDTKQDRAGVSSDIGRVAKRNQGMDPPQTKCREYPSLRGGLPGSIQPGPLQQWQHGILLCHPGVAVVGENTLVRESASELSHGTSCHPFGRVGRGVLAVWSKGWLLGLRFGLGKPVTR